MDWNAPHFADRLTARVRSLRHPLCVGLDPHLGLVPEAFRQGSMRPGDPRTAAAVGELLAAVVDRLEKRVAIVKPQIAFFEALGVEGIRVLGELVARARRRDLLVLLDAKRGDLGSTARGYAAAYLGDDAPLRVDAMTLNPYLGLDSLEPFLDATGGGASGVFVLVRTSNPGAADFQERRLDGAPLYERVAEALAPQAAALRGPASGWSSLGVVVGATAPEQAPRVRALLPHSIFLVPGYGAQGAGAADALRGFVPGPAGLEGGIVNSSRGIVFPEAGASGDAARWERAFEAALDAAIDDLGNAASGVSAGAST